MQKTKFKRSLNYLILSLSSALAYSSTSIANDNNATMRYETNRDVGYTEQTYDNSNFSQAQLEQMLAPIALYPDALLTHILIASTYPIEVVEAERWLSSHNQLSANAIVNAADDKDWDASVKALLSFPNVLQKLSADLQWMRNLGDAFLQNEAQLLASVQTLRRRADQTGNLDSMNNVKVVRDTQTIIIEPQQPNIIYVPYYDTRVVYGHWRWSHYPPIYWHQPTRYVSHHGPYYWHDPIHLTVGLFFGAVHWTNRHVIVHRHKSRYYKHHSNRKVTHNSQSMRWQHNPRHRKGVAYRTTNIQKKYRSHTPSMQQHRVMREKQKHLAHKNIKANSNKHQNLKKKLSVNRSVSKHNQSHLAQNAKLNKKVKREKYHAVNKQRVNKHNTVPSSIKREPGLTNQGKKIKGSSKPEHSVKRSTSHKQSNKVTRNNAKRSHEKVARSTKSRVEHSNQGRPRQHH